MSLRFIYGRAGYGKTYTCLNEIKSKIDSGFDKPLVLLVPEDYSFQAEKDLLKVVGEKGLMKAQVLSFKRMAYHVFKEAGGLTRKHMNNAGRCILLGWIMDGIKDEFTVFNKAVRMKGFVNTMSDMITEFKVYGVGPDDIKDAEAKVEDDMLKGKLHDIGILYTEFEQALGQVYVDQEDDLAILAKKLDSCSIFDGGEIWVDGFSMLTPQQYLILEKLIKRVDRMNVTLCCGCSNSTHVDRADVFSPIKDIERKLLEIAAENNISYEKPVILDSGHGYKFADNPEMDHLEKNFYAFPYERYDKPTENISIFKSLNRYSEVEQAAREIIALCRDEGLRYKDIAVAARDVSAYEKLVGAIFNEYGIPFFIDRKRDINSNPITVLILSAIDILSKNWSYEAVFSYLKTNLTGISIEDVDLLENYVLSAGIKGRRWTDKEPWKFWPDYGYEGDLPEDAKERLAHINAIREEVCAPLLKLKDDVDKSSNAAEICRALYDFVCSLKVPDRIEQWVGKFKSEGQLDLAGEYSRVWNIIIEILDQIAEALGDAKISPDQLSKLLSIGIGEYKIGLIPPSIDQVIFGSVERIKSHNIKVLYILGVNDGVFPSALGDEGVLNDSDRECLNTIGLKLAPGTRDRVFDEQYLIYTTLTRPTQKLKIFYPIADSEGKAMRPSIIVSRLKKIFGSIYEYGNINPGDTYEDNLKLINSAAPTFNELVCSIRKNADGMSVNPVWKDVYSWYINNDDWREKTLKILSGTSDVNQEKPVNPERARELYGKNLKFSISRLEKYAQCPFAFFMQYGLKARERKIYELSPPDIGSFIHTILDKFSVYTDEKGLKWRELGHEECNEIVSSLVDDEVKNMSGSILQSSARYKYFKKRLERMISKAVWMIVLQIKRGGFEPVEHEVAFEENGKYPPISVDLPSGEKIKLVGRIDRVDKLENEDGIYIRIVDYKSGNKAFDLSSIYNGLELQLLIYLDAILDYVSKNSSKPVFPGGILYFRVNDPMVPFREGMSDDDIEKEIMKEFKMRGLLLSDVKVVSEMDHQIGNVSLTVPAGISSDGTFSRYSSVASCENFDGLRKHVKGKVVELCEQMLKGGIAINPYKRKKGTPCQYCSFKPVCRFDPAMKDNSYRIIDEKSNDEVWGALNKETSKKGGAENGMDA